MKNVMKCPSCKSPLREKDADGMTVDMCYGGCGGIWFDAKEIEHLTARAAASLHSIWQAPVGKLNLAEPRRCPRCEEQLLERKWFSDLKKVEIDQCPQCGGVWLDAGEFSRVYDEIKGPKLAPPGWLRAMGEAAKVVDPQGSKGPKPDAT